MKIIIVGATGTIGKKVTAAFEKGNEVVKVGHSGGDVQVDINSSESIENLFKQVGPFDALISATGDAHFGPMKSMTRDQFKKGLDSKLMGQVDLVLIGQRYINSGGSFTLTSGSLAEDPIMNGTNISTVNAAINAFVMAAAVELKNDVRINAVSPGVLEDSPFMHPAFPGHIPVPMDRVIMAYVKSVKGAKTGDIIKVQG